MEKAAVTGKSAGSRWEISLGACAALAACVACPGLQAQEVDKSSSLQQQQQGMLMAEARIDQPVRLEVQTSTLPRLEAQDSGFQAPRVDLSLFPATSPNFGAVLGMSGFSNRQPQTPGLQAPRPSVDLGVRYSQRLQSRQVDVTAWRRMTNDDDAITLAQMRQPVYGARVELNLKPSKGPVSLDGGFIGMQLEGGAKIAIKRKDGRPMVYYRTAF
jgi:hypothetical protein